MKPETSAQVDEIISAVKYIGAAIICAVIINRFIIFNAYIPSASMENTIMTDDRVIGFRIPYMMESPERFDVAIFKFPDDEKDYFVKRVIGLPGETVKIVGGKVYIDDAEAPLDEPYLKEEANVEDFGPYEVPEGCYFMLGDNRNWSRDSRFWVNTFVEEDKIYAKSYASIWPKPHLIE